MNLRKFFLLLLTATMLFASCQRDDTPAIIDPALSDATFLVLNEGQFGKTPTSINRYYNGKWTLRLYQTANPGKTPGGTGVSITRHGSSMYIVSKDNCFLSQINQADFKEIARIEAPKGGANPLGGSAQARNFCIVDDKTGVLTTSNGAFTVSLQPLALGKPLTNIDANNSACGDVYKAGSYLFLVNNKTIKVYSADKLAFVKDLGEIGDTFTGFVQTDETLWAANGIEMIKINIKTLAIERIPLGGNIAVFNNAGAYTATQLRLSKSGDAIYFVKAESYSGKEIWKFDIASGKASLLYKPAAKNISVYGSALAVHPATGDIYAIYIKEDYLTTYIHVIDTKKGKQKAIIPYTKIGETEYWFPAMLIFG